MQALFLVRLWQHHRSPETWKRPKIHTRPIGQPLGQGLGHSLAGARSRREPNSRQHRRDRDEHALGPQVRERAGGAAGGSFLMGLTLDVNLAMHMRSTALRSSGMIAGKSLAIIAAGRRLLLSAKQELLRTNVSTPNRMNKTVAQKRTS